MKHVYDPKLQPLFLGDSVIARSNRLFLKVYYTEDGATIPLVTDDPESLVVYDEQGQHILFEKDTYREVKRLLQKCNGVLFKCTAGRWWRSEGFNKAVTKMSAALGLTKSVLRSVLEDHSDLVLAFISTLADYYDLDQYLDEKIGEDARFDLAPLSMLAEMDRRLLGCALKVKVLPEKPVVSETFYV